MIELAPEVLTQYGIGGLSIFVLIIVFWTFKKSFLEGYDKSTDRDDEFIKHLQETVEKNSIEIERLTLQNKEQQKEINEVKASLSDCAKESAQKDVIIENQKIQIRLYKSLLVKNKIDYEGVTL